MSFCFFINWIVDYGITRATPHMITDMGYGTFLLYSLLTYTGVVFIYLYAFGWSFGHSVACYVVAAEIFPTRIVRARIQKSLRSFSIR